MDDEKASKFIGVRLNSANTDEHDLIEYLASKGNQARELKRLAHLGLERVRGGQNENPLLNDFVIETLADKLSKKLQIQTASEEVPEPLDNGSNKETFKNVWSGMKQNLKK